MWCDSCRGKHKREDCKYTNGAIYPFYPGMANRFSAMMFSGRFVLWKWVAMPDHWAVIGFNYRAVYKN